MKSGIVRVFKSLLEEGILRNMSNVPLGATRPS